MRQQTTQTLISIVTGCYNEEGNVRELAARIRAVFEKLPQFTFEHIFIDNASTDGTAKVLRALASEDPCVKVIFNTRNFGHIRSPYHGILQANGAAVIAMASDLQDPPELIPAFLERWAHGFRVVMGVKASHRESWLMAGVRKAYYDWSGRFSDIRLVKNFTGFGLYDRSVLEVLKKIDDPYPYFRGLIADLGFEAAQIAFEKPGRLRGITKNNFYTLYDLAMLGITNHSKVPLRIATMAGFSLSAVSLLLAIAYFVGKIAFWDQFSFGLAPILIGFFFFMSVQLFFIGMIGEYVGAIHTQVLKRPHVIERERLNF